MLNTINHIKEKEEAIPLPLTSVGITGLEPATSRPPDVCATNCAKSRTFAVAFLLLRVQRYGVFTKLPNFSESFFQKTCFSTKIEVRKH